MIRPADIAFVEESPHNIRLTKTALKESRLTKSLQIVTDGVEVMDFFRKRENYTNVSTPDLTLLDLNLPKKSGFEVLREIKASLRLRIIPVVMLTTSVSERNILLSCQMHVNGFVSKPVYFDSFYNVIRRIEDFWFSIVKLPKP